MGKGEHWERVFSAKKSQEVSWYQPHLRVSMSLFDRAGVSPNSHVVDIGGGDSTLVDDLLARDIRNVTVLDISSQALRRAMRRLGPHADRVKWIEADITLARLGRAAYDIWHDRAVFHFLLEAKDRAGYKRALSSSLRPSGHVIIGTFAADGPTRCSGLPTKRYSSEELEAELAPDFQLIETQNEIHQTPSGAEQRFLYCLLKSRNSSDSF